MKLINADANSNKTFLNSKFKVGDIVSDKNNPMVKYKILVDHGVSAGKVSGTRHTYLVRDLKQNNNIVLSEDAMVNSRVRSLNYDVAPGYTTKWSGTLAKGTKVSIVDSPMRYGGERGEIVGKFSYGYQVRLIDRNDKPIVDLYPNQIAVKNSSNSRIRSSNPVVANSRKTVKSGQNNWSGEAVVIYLEADGTYTFWKQGEKKDKTGLTRDGAMKLFEQEVNGPRYNSRVRSSNPVVANALARNARYDLENDPSVKDTVRLMEKVGRKWVKESLSKGELAFKDSKNVYRYDDVAEALKEAKELVGATGRNAVDTPWQFVVGKTYTDKTGRVKMRVTGRVASKLEYKTAGGYGTLPIGVKTTPDGDRYEYVEMGAFTFRSDGRRG